MCKLCETKPVYFFTNKRQVCKTCFIRYIQKKFLTTIRKFEMIPRDSVIGYENKMDFRGAVLENLLEMFVDRGVAKIIKLPTKKKLDRIALSSTTDSEAQEIVNVLFNGKFNVEYFSPANKKIIKPLYLFLDKEILLYAKLKKLKFKNIKEDRDNLNKFVNELEKKHPEIKHAIIQSYLGFESVR